jgi:transketolase
MLSEDLQQDLHLIANTIRGLSIDAVQKANSGHPGLPLGCADIAAYLYGAGMRYNPKDPHWANRDRFVLSAGHGSMLLYSCLALAGYDLHVEDLKKFRQWHSKPPGHPEVHETAGVEATTGPLGQGTGNAVGMALAGQLLAAQFNTPEETLFDYKVFCLCSDGDLMEGVSHEVCSFAGHLQLNNLIFLYDNNGISLDGPTTESLSDDARLRFEAYGWEVHHISGYDSVALDTIITAARQSQTRPLMIICDTQIGKGSPNKAGSHEAHGSPLGQEEAALTKKNLGIPEEEFFVPQAVIDFFSNRMKREAARQQEWEKVFAAWSQHHPDQRALFDKMRNQHVPADLEEKLKAVPVPASVAGRAISGTYLQTLASILPQLVGGSADLSGSDKTFLKSGGVVSRGHFKGRNIKYGVREFGMATICNGLSLTEMFLPYCGTFLTFSDYMRNAIRLAALSHLPVIYQFTHDSILLGEDGPTHQPVEQLASLRAMPNLQTLRPADAHEVRGAWIAALQHKGPSAIVLTRQNLPTLAECDVPFSDGVGRGAYIVKREEGGPPHVTLFATGSELHLALQVAQELIKRGKNVRVVSLPSWEIFARQPAAYQQSVAGGDLGLRVSIEAASPFGWGKFIGVDGLAIAVEGFGASAPAEVLAEQYGFTVDHIMQRILGRLNR